MEYIIMLIVSDKEKGLRIFLINLMKKRTGRRILNYERRQRKHKRDKRLIMEMIDASWALAEKKRPSILWNQAAAALCVSTNERELLMMQRASINTSFNREWGEWHALIKGS